MIFLGPSDPLGGSVTWSAGTS